MTLLASLLATVIVAGPAAAGNSQGADPRAADPRAADPKDRTPAYRVSDPSLVYLGNPRLFKKPCVVSADRVYASIPEYREILEKNLTDKDVRYHFLMQKASDKFSRALREVARDEGYDLVAGVGAVAPATPETPPIPDVTSSVIAKLPA